MAGRIWSSGENEVRLLSTSVPSAVTGWLSAGAADLLRQMRQFDSSTFPRGLPSRIQYLHHDHIGLE
jgi:hypothetical protein